MATFLRCAWLGGVPVLLLVAGCGFFSLEDSTADDDDDGSGATGGSSVAGSGGSLPAAGGSAGAGGGSAGSDTAGTGGSSNGSSGAAGSGGSDGGIAGSGGAGAGGAGASGGSGASGGDGAGGSSGGTGGTGGGDAGGGTGGSGGSTPMNCAERMGEVFEGHCYRAFTTPATWPEARDACEELGGYLATISSDGVGQTEFDAENAFVWGLVDNQETWIGLSDGRGDMDPGDGTPFGWVGGEGIAIDNWSDGEPNNYQKDCPNGGPTNACFEHCGLIPADRSGQWNDEVCGYEKPYVCEWDSVE